ncbi:MAG: glycosyltransferase [Elusimicrobiota bacterium]|jgi:glycosyltransferase involved in cell wall biosynthesis|nr:glycosyltransferase [Elusimicrobiota bacterium]
MSNYNQAKFIKQAVESVLSQKTNFKFVLTIVDDNSTKDNSVEIIKDYANSYPDIIKPIFAKQNVGYLGNVLRASQDLNTKYFALLDADDYYTDENKLQKAFDFLESNPHYTIYSTNTLRVYDDGRRVPYINTDIKEKDFTFDDYVADNAVLPCTPGLVFRNVIFSKGVPQLLKDAIGTISERSFEGDGARFPMHLYYGKAKFVNHIDGIYRVTNDGIWMRLSDFDRGVLIAKMFADLAKFFDAKYKIAFLAKSYIYAKEALRTLKLKYDFANPATAAFQQSSFIVLHSVLSQTLEHKDEVNEYIKNNPIKKKINLKNKIRLMLFNKLEKSLQSKNLI